MSGSFREVVLDEIATFHNGKAIKPGGVGTYPVFGSNGLIGGADTFQHASGIVLGRVGAYCGSVVYCANPFWASDNTIVVRPKGRTNERFLSYLLRHLNLNSYAGGSAQPLLTQTVLRQIKAVVPDVSIQDAIAGRLAAYDDLIENNTRRIGILEERAQAIYREWFVNLRFPSHEQVEIVESPLGRIPAGWEIWTAKQAVNRLPAGTTYTEKDVKATGSVPVVDQSRSELLGFHDNEPDHLASPDHPIIIFGDHTCNSAILLRSECGTVLLRRAFSCSLHLLLGPWTR